jgi:hypothetical protein
MIPRSAVLTRHLEPAQWVLDGLPCRRDIGALATFMPTGFGAYIRVLHPAGFGPARPGAQDLADAKRWAALAAASGVRLGPETTFPEILSPAELPKRYQIQPLSGSLPPEHCAALVSVLGAHTTTPAAGWFCLWEGNGSLWGMRERADGSMVPAGDDLLDSYPRLVLGTGLRRYFLCHGPLVAACLLYDEIGATPNIWWPEDRAWIAVTEVDSYSTYVGCGRMAAADLLAAADLEAIEVSLRTRIDPGL